MDCGCRSGGCRWCRCSHPACHDAPSVPMSTTSFRSWPSLHLHLDERWPPHIQIPPGLQATSEPSSPDALERPMPGWHDGITGVARVACGVSFLHRCCHCWRSRADAATRRKRPPLSRSLTIHPAHVHAAQLTFQAWNAHGGGPSTLPARRLCVSAAATQLLFGAGGETQRARARTVTTPPSQRPTPTNTHRAREQTPKERHDSEGGSVGQPFGGACAELRQISLSRRAS